MRVAVATGVLGIPPTYFVVNAAEQLRDVHDFHVFALAASISDAEISVPISDYVPLRALPLAARAALGPLATGRMTAGLRRWDPHLLHQHFATWSDSVVEVAAGGTPLITTVHGYDVFLALRRPRGPYDVLRQRQIARAQRSSSRVLAVSHYLAREAVSAGFAADRLEVHYQGVDTDFFVPGDPSTRESPPTVVFVGALAIRKGIRDAVQASIALAAAVEHRLVIIGSGPLESEVRRSIAASPHIRLAGTLDKLGVRRALQGADLLVLPTQETDGWREAAGLVLIEAQACGTPVVTYESGGAPEMLLPGETGLVAPERDVMALTDAMAQILTLERQRYESMRRDARAFAVAERSLARSAEELLAHYAAVV